MKRRALQFHIITGILLLGVLLYQLMHVTGPVMFPDEFGYWANAAYLLGYDWSGSASLQPYYSFGYSLLLLPLLQWITDPAALYRAAILLNAVFVYLHASLLWRTACRLFHGQGTENLLFCLTAAFYPALLFNMQLTWPECLLSFLFLWSVWLLLRYEETRRGIYGLAFMLCIVFQQFVHMRSLGVLAAGTAVLFCMKGTGGRLPWKKAVLWCAAAVVCLAAGTVLKGLLQDGLYAKAEQAIVKANDYSGQIPKLAALFTADGIRAFAVSCLGKLFYLGLATNGTVYFALLFLWKRRGEGRVYRYLLLSAVLTFCITALYLMSGGRADTFLYGRYNEFLMPLFVCLGLRGMSQGRRVWSLAAGIAVLNGAAAAVLARAMAREDPGLFQGYFTVGISYALREYMPRVQDYLYLPYAAGTAAMLLLVLVTGFLMRRRKCLTGYLGLFLGFYIYTAVAAGPKYLYDHSADTRADMLLARQARELLGEGEAAWFIASGSDAQYVGVLQWCLREIPVRVMGEDSAITVLEERPAAVFTYHRNKQEALLRQLYDRSAETFHFQFYYNSRGYCSRLRHSQQQDGHVQPF